MRCSLLSFLLGVTALHAAAESIVVGKYPAKIVPQQISEISLPENGLLSDLADETQHQQADAVIAIINKEQTAEERENLELKIARERISLTDDMRKLQAQRRQVKFYLSLSKEERRYNTDFKSDPNPPTQESLKDIDERIALLQKELDSLERRHTKEFDRKHNPLTLRMPFSGRLQYNVILPEDRSKPFRLPEVGGRSFATVCDDSAFYITIALSEGSNALLKPENFSVTVSLPEGQQLRGEFAFRRVERQASADLLAYYFRVPKEAHEQAFSMLGGKYTATLHYEAGSGITRVSKASLATHPKAEQCSDWEELISIAYPDHNIVIIGTRDIILRPKQ